MMEDAEAYERRLEEIDELLPLKYRYPKTYRPPSYVYDRAGSLPPTRASSVPPMRASSVPPLTTPPLRAMTPLRTYTPPPRYPSEKVGYSYAGKCQYNNISLTVNHKCFNYFVIYHNVNEKIKISVWRTIHDFHVLRLSLIHI